MLVVGAYCWGVRGSCQALGDLLGLTATSMKGLIILVPGVSCWSAEMTQVHEVGEGLELPPPVKSSLYSTTSEGPLTLPCVSWICPGSSENLWDSHRSCKDRDKGRHPHYRFRTGRMPGSLEANHIHEEGVLPSSEFRQFLGWPGL